MPGFLDALLVFFDLVKTKRKISSEIRKSANPGVHEQQSII